MEQTERKKANMKNERYKDIKIKKERKKEKKQKGERKMREYKRGTPSFRKSKIKCSRGSSKVAIILGKLPFSISPIYTRGRERGSDINSCSM